MVLEQSEIKTVGVEAESRGRMRVLREARALFTAEGFAAVSMQQIADAATINKATLYHHFRDKEALFLSVIASEIRRGGMERDVPHPAPDMDGISALVSPRDRCRRP